MSDESAHSVAIEPATIDAHPEATLLEHHQAARERRAERDRERRTIGLNLVAMIDVVFLLLIYFLLTTNFTIGEEIYQLELPEEVRGQQYDPFDLPDQPVTVTVQSTGAGRGDYSISLDLPTDRPTLNVEGLYRFLNSERVSDANPGGLLLPDTPILIRPLRTTRWDHAVNAFNAALRAQYTHVRFIDPV